MKRLGAWMVFQVVVLCMTLNGGGHTGQLGCSLTQWNDMSNAGCVVCCVLLLAA